MLHKKMDKWINTHKHAITLYNFIYVKLKGQAELIYEKKKSGKWLPLGRGECVMIRRRHESGFWSPGNFFTYVVIIYIHFEKIHCSKPFLFVHFSVCFKKYFVKTFFMNYLLFLGNSYIKTPVLGSHVMADALRTIAGSGTCLSLWSHFCSGLYLSFLPLYLISNIFFNLNYFWNFRQHFSGLGTGGCFSTHIIYKKNSEDINVFKFWNVFCLKSDSIWLLWKHQCFLQKSWPLKHVSIKYNSLQMWLWSLRLKHWLCKNHLFPERDIPH